MKNSDLAVILELAAEQIDLWLFMTSVDVNHLDTDPELLFLLTPIPNDSGFSIDLEFLEHLDANLANARVS
jgi:hypothetical protein